MERIEKESDDGGKEWRWRGRVTDDERQEVKINSGFSSSWLGWVNYGFLFLFYYRNKKYFGKKSVFIEIRNGDFWCINGTCFFINY